MAAIESDALIELCADLGQRFAARAGAHDRDGSFPVEDFDEQSVAGLSQTVRDVVLRNYRPSHSSSVESLQQDRLEDAKQAGTGS